MLQKSIGDKLELAVSCEVKAFSQDTLLRSDPMMLKTVAQALEQRSQVIFLVRCVWNVGIEPLVHSKDSVLSQPNQIGVVSRFVVSGAVDNYWS
jgi:hypothetical protein